MKKLERVNRPEMACVMDTYQFDGKMVVSDIPKYVKALKSVGIKLNNFRLSNSEREYEHFFRVFSTLSEFERYTWDEGCAIDDFGVSCDYNGIIFHLTFNFNTDHVLVFHQDKMDIEPLLSAVGSSVQRHH